MVGVAKALDKVLSQPPQPSLPSLVTCHLPRQPPPLCHDSDTPVRYIPMRHTPVECTLMRYTPLRCMPVRCTPMRYTPVGYTHMRCTPMRYRPINAIPCTSNTSSNLGGL